MGPKSRSRSKVLGEIFGVDHSYVVRATELLQDAPRAAASVKAGRVSLTAAYEALKVGRACP